MAINAFRQQGSKIVWCIVDNHERCASGWAKEISINLTDHMLFKLDMFNFDILIGTDEDELLLCASLDYEHAVVVASGTSFTLADRIYGLVEELCTKDFFIAGHILDRGEAMPELHHQFYVVNLKEYSENAWPSIGKGKEFNSLDALWHGHNIMRIAGDRAIDIGDDIRNAKKYLYYEYDHVFLKEVSSIYYNQFFATNFFAAWNSDDLRTSIQFNGPVDQYVTVGIGLHWVRNLELVEFTDNTSVIFTDINNSCLMYMKKLIETWDGKDYVEFYKQNTPSMPNGQSVIPESYYDKTQLEWEQFVATFDDWPAMWNRVRQLHFKYILTDYTATYNFDWLESGKRTLMNLSDLFTHTPYVFLHSLKYRIACENKLFNLLVAKDPEITVMLTSRATDGFIENNQLVAKAKDFKLTNIEELKCPPWHVNDWTTMKQLGQIT